MVKKVYYFNLIDTFKAEATRLVEAKECLQTSDVMTAISDLKWFNLPNKIKTLVAAVNATIPPENSYKITNTHWYKIVNEINNLLNFLEEINC